MIYVNCIALNTRWKWSIFAELIMGNLALGAATIICTGYNSLLRVIANKCSQDWVAVAPDSIHAHHRHTQFSTGSDRSQDIFHTHMEQVSQSMGSSSLAHHLSQVSHWNIANQNLCTAWWLSANGLWDISDCEVDWICHLSTEDGKACLIRRHDDRHYRCTWLTWFNGCLVLIVSADSC